MPGERQCGGTGDIQLEVVVLHHADLFGQLQGRQVRGPLEIHGGDHQRAERAPGRRAGQCRLTRGQRPVQVTRPELEEALDGVDVHPRAAPEEPSLAEWAQGGRVVAAADRGRRPTPSRWWSCRPPACRATRRRCRCC